MNNNQLNRFGLGALVVSAVIATGSFGYTMVQHPTVTQGLTTPTLASADGAEPRVKRVGDLAIIAAPSYSALTEDHSLVPSPPDVSLQSAVEPNKRESLNSAATSSDSELAAATGAASDAPIEGISPTEADIVVLQIDPAPDSAATTVPVPAEGLSLSPSDELSVDEASSDSSTTNDLSVEGEASALSLPQLAPTTTPTGPSGTAANTNNGTANDAVQAATVDDDNQPRRNSDERRRSRQGGGNRRDQGGPALPRG